MEIIHLILGKANPTRMNGVNKVVFQLASQQAHHGRTVQVWGITATPDEHNYGARTFETRLFQSYRNPFRISAGLRNALIEKSKTNTIVHLHGGWIPVFFSLARLMKRLHIPFVITPHGAYNTEAMRRSRWIKIMYRLLFERYILRHAAAVHCIGASEVTGLSGIYKTNKAALLPYGFIPSPTASTPVTASARARMVVGFVGRLDIHTKGLDILLDAVAAMQDEKPSVWIIGDGPERSALEAMIRARGLDSYVTCLGSKFGDDKDQWMKQMDVFVHPSRNEGLPSAVLEAASLGIPCVVSAATNMGEYIEQFDAGYVVRTADADSLRMGLETMWIKHQTGMLRSLGEHARMMVSQAFNWSKLVDDFDSLYHHDTHRTTT